MPTQRVKMHGSFSLLVNPASIALIDRELEPGEEVALESGAGLLEAVDRFLYKVDFVFAVGADLCMAGRVFHEDNLVVEEAALEKGGDEVVRPDVPAGFEPQMGLNLNGNKDMDRRVA